MTSGANGSENAGGAGAEPAGADDTDSGGTGRSDHRSGVADALKRETEVARAMLANMRDIIANDDDIALNTVEGETSLLEAIQRGVERLSAISALEYGLSEHISVMQARRERLLKQAELMRTLIMSAIEAAGQKRIELPTATLTLKAVAPSIRETNAADIPARFWKPQDPKLDKRALLVALKDGETVPGVELSNGGVTLQISPR